MGNADYFYKIDNSKTAIIVEAKQELDKKHIKNLDNRGKEFAYKTFVFNFKYILYCTINI